MTTYLPKNLLYESAPSREKRENIEFSKKNPSPQSVETLLTYPWPVHLNWGDWFLDENNFSLDLLPDCHFGKWSHEEPLYSINLLEICSANDMVNWFFHLQGKDPSLYGENMIIDLFYAFKEIFGDFKHDLGKVGTTISPKAAINLHLKKYKIYRAINEN